MGSSQPGQVAVNEETGDVYVVDRGNGRVEIFSSSGAYVGQFNGTERRREVMVACSATWRKEQFRRRGRGRQLDEPIRSVRR